MSRQESGWPLGLQPLNMRIGIVRNRDLSGSCSFSTLITGTPSSSSFSSTDFDAESNGSFFHNHPITLGNLLGATTILNLSRRRSIRGRAPESKKNYKTWFSLCTRACADADSISNPQSLGQFLEVERRATNTWRRNQNSTRHELAEFLESRSLSEPNSLFVNGEIGPPQVDTNGPAPIPLFGSDAGSRPNIPLVFSCVCGQPTN